MKKIITALLTIGLIGCSTEPVKPQNAKEVQPATQFLQKPKTTGVTIVRDKGFISGGCAITSYINGERLAELQTGEKVTAYLPAGEVNVGAGFAGRGLCSGSPKKEREFIIKDNQPRTLRIFIDQSGNVDILPMTIN